MFEYLDGIGVNRVVNLGDVVGYNANPNECCDLMRERNIPTICGNHDAVACGLDEPTGFNPVALTAALWTREKLREDNLEWLRGLPATHRFNSTLAVHGSPRDRDTYLFGWEEVIPEIWAVEEQGCECCFFGHTHSPGIFGRNGVYTVDNNSKFSLGTGDVYFVNPGSVGQPRDGDARSAFGFFDTESREYEQVRINYPVKQAATKITNEGLPSILAERLFLGR